MQYTRSGVCLRLSSPTPLPPRSRDRPVPVGERSVQDRRQLRTLRTENLGEDCKADVSCESIGSKVTISTTCGAASPRSTSVCNSRRTLEIPPNQLPGSMSEQATILDASLKLSSRSRTYRELLLESQEHMAVAETLSEARNSFPPGKTVSRQAVRCSRSPLIPLETRGPMRRTLISMHLFRYCLSGQVRR